MRSKPSTVGTEEEHMGVKDALVLVILASIAFVFVSYIFFGP